MKLSSIFALFLGLVLTAFIGVGVYTFYPSPDAGYNERIRELTREQQAVRNLKSPDALSPQERARVQAATDEINRLQDAARSAREGWGRNTSIILIVFSTLLMAISLTRAQALPVINNGLLIGGIVTMIYGVGWIVATTTSIARFVVMTVALVATLTLGYVRFVRGERTIPAAAAAPDGLATLEQRIAALEKRLDDAASVLGRRA